MYDNPEVVGAMHAHRRVLLEDLWEQALLILREVVDAHEAHDRVCRQRAEQPSPFLSQPRF